MTKNEVILRINDLLSNGTTRKAKYLRNYSLYNQTPISDLNAKIPATVGYLDDVVSDEAIVPKINVVKSAIDAVVSKISTAHCRPFVNSVRGSFKTIQICKQLQIFFDYYFDETNAAAKISEALRDCCIFESGHLYLDEETGELKVVQPWNVYTRQREKSEYKSAYIEFPNASTDSLKDSDYKLLTASEKKSLYTTIGFFYDSKTKTKATLINRQIREIKSVSFDIVPLVSIYYTAPILGNSTLSIADMLKGIQAEIDLLMTTIAEASAINPALTYFISNASNIKVGQLNNKIGNIVQYNASNGAAIETSTPNFIGSQYITMLDNLMEKAYNMVGISQLSAQGKKPAGLDSGVALATQADIESDRFQVLLDQYIRLHTNLAKMCIKIFKSDEEIIQPNRYNLRLTWEDVEKDWDKMRIQFSAADALSKDPSEKLKQLQTLAQAGIIPATQIASLLELPDINRGYSIANNAYNACQTLIDQCIYEDKYEVPDYVPFQMLKEQIINMELSLRTAQGSENGNEKDIEKLAKYFSKIEKYEKELTGMQKQATAQDVNENNAYSAQNNEEFGNGTEENLNMENEEISNPYSTSVANNGELDKQ